MSYFTQGQCSFLMVNEFFEIGPVVFEISSFKHTNSSALYNFIIITV